MLELLCSVTVMVSPTCAWTMPGSCDSTTLVVLAADALGLGLALASLPESVVAVSPHALIDSASRAVAPIAPMTPILPLTSHLRWLCS